MPDDADRHHSGTAGSRRPYKTTDKKTLKLTAGARTIYHHKGSTGAWEEDGPSAGSKTLYPRGEKPKGGSFQRGAA